jgi:hypothetical protein
MEQLQTSIESAPADPKVAVEQERLQAENQRTQAEIQGQQQDRQFNQQLQQGAQEFEKYKFDQEIGFKREQADKAIQADMLKTFVGAQTTRDTAQLSAQTTKETAQLGDATARHGMILSAREKNLPAGDVLGEEAASPIEVGLAQIAQGQQAIGEAITQLSMAMAGMAQALTAPRQVIRGENGEIVGAVVNGVPMQTTRNDQGDIAGLEPQGNA